MGGGCPHPHSYSMKQLSTLAVHLLLSASCLAWPVDSATIDLTNRPDGPAPSTPVVAAWFSFADSSIDYAGQLDSLDWRTYTALDLQAAAVTRAGGVEWDVPLDAVRQFVETARKHDVKPTFTLVSQNELDRSSD